MPAPDPTSAEAILRHYPIAGDGAVLGISAEMGETLIRAGLAVRRGDGGFRLTARGYRAKESLTTAGPGKLKTVGGGGTVVLHGGLARIRTRGK